MKIFIAFLFMFIVVSHAADSCSAASSILRRAGDDWTEGNNKFTTYDLSIMNSGNCALDLIRLQFTLPSGALISQAWNIEPLENGIWEVKNFGPLLNVGATITSSGLILQYQDQATLSVAVINTNCQCDSSTPSPTSTPTTPPTLPPSQPTASPDFVTSLITAPSQLHRLMLLRDDQFVFDFKNSVEGVSQSDGGRTVATSRSNFPAVIGHNIAMTVGFIEPCGINLPHTHPRATEINFVASGRFQAGFIMENEARFIANTLEAGMATVFPQGAIHFEVNFECEPAVFVAAFNNEDPGVQTTANSFFGLPSKIAAISLNVSEIQTVEDLMRLLPSNPAMVMKECRIRCGLDD